MRLSVIAAGLLVVALVSFGADARKLYHGHRVYRVYPATAEQVSLLRELMPFKAHKGGLDFHTRPAAINQAVDIRVAPSAINKFTAFLRKNRMQNKIHIEDVQKHIDRVEEINRHLQASRPNNVGDIVGTFASQADINTWLQAQCTKYTNITKCGTWGKSYEGRDMQYIRVGKIPPGPVSPRKAIYIVSGMHAREWLGPATMVWIINQMLTQYGTDQDITTLVNTYDFYIEPVVNPDGYEYSRSDDRYWRKTRSPTSDDSCPGVDGNRNFDYKWTGGGDPCDEDFSGTSSFTEHETINIDAFMKKQNKTQHALAFFSIHTYSSVWLLPYGYATHAYPADYQDLLNAGTAGVNALMAVHNTQWQVGNIVDLLYVAAGNSADYYKGHSYVKYSQALELRGDDFVVPQSDIVPSGQEVWAGFVAAIKAMEQ